MNGDFGEVENLSCEKNSGLSMEETFTKIYATDAWGKGSGAGSVPVHCLKWLLGPCNSEVPPNRRETVEKEPRPLKRDMLQSQLDFYVYIFPLNNIGIDIYVVSL